MADVPLMNNPMTAAGDVIYGGASGAPTRLAIGTAGQALVVNAGATAVEWDDVAGAGGYSEGTSFPGTPSAGDKFFHNTYDRLFFYDGTRWLCTCPHEVVLPNTLGYLGASGVTAAISPPTDAKIWLQDWFLVTFVATTLSGSHYWTPALYKYTAAAAPTLIIDQALSADSPDAYVSRTKTINAEWDPAAHKIIAAFVSKTGTPGALTFLGTLRYRLIGV